MMKTAAMKRFKNWNIFLILSAFLFSSGPFHFFATPAFAVVKKKKKKKNPAPPQSNVIDTERASIERESAEKDLEETEEEKTKRTNRDQEAELSAAEMDKQLAAPENSLLPAPVDITPKALSASEKLPTAQENSLTLTLEDCTKIALQGATTILKSQNDVEYTGMLLLQSYAQFLPNIGTTGTYQILKGNNYFTFTSPTSVHSQMTSVNFNLTSTFNIFNGLADLANLKAAMHRKDAADLTFNRAKQQIILDIAQSFLQVVLDNEIVIIAKKNLLLSQERQKLLEEQTRVGVRNLADLFRQQAQTSADELFLMNSLNKERSDEILLLRKLREDVAKSYKLLPPKIQEGKKDPKYNDEIKLIELGIEKRTDLKASQNLADAGNWEVHRTAADYYPKLNLWFNGFSTSTTLQKQLVEGVSSVPAFQNSLYDQLGYQNYYTAGLTLTFNLFDRWTTRLAVANTRRTADNLEVDAVDRRLQVEGEIRQAYGDYQTGLQLLESSKKGLESAIKAYEVTQGRYEVGAASFVDLITAQTSLVQAESSRAQALIGFLLQQKTMEFALGET